MVSGESHYFLGQRYRLRVVNANGCGEMIIRKRCHIELHVRQEATADQRKRVLQRWYRRQLKKIIPPLVQKWQTALDVQANQWAIKKMKTKWGTCNVEARRIWLNLELAKKPLQCLEYIIVHELLHFRQRHHDERFIAMLDEHLPKWRAYRQELNSAPLAHENWTY